MQRKNQSVLFGEITAEMLSPVHKLEYKLKPPKILAVA